MDETDKFFKKFYPTFYDVYQPEQNVSNAFKKNIPRILKEMCEKYGFKNYGVIDAYQNTSNAIHLAKTPRMKRAFPPPQRCAGLISLEMNPKVGGGHWAAWVYFPGRRHIFVYDSMMKKGKSNFLDNFKQVLRKYFDNPTISPAPCASCGELKGIRLVSESRQPTGGFVSGEEKLVKAGKELSASDYQRVLGYRSQHQYCFGEALLFLEDVMRGNTSRRACPTGKLALIQVKKFIYNKLTSLGQRVDPNFLKIYNPETRNSNKI